MASVVMATLDIAPRQPGETEEEFTRRHCREKMRIYRARKPKNDRKRGKGKAPLKTSSLTTEEWLSLQPTEGEDPAAHKRRYNAAMQARYRERHALRLAEERRAAYAENPEPERERHRRTHLEHPERQREYDRRYDEKNPGKRRATLEAWAKANPERLKASKERWISENRALLASYSAKWRKAARIATPAWADFDLIRAFYEEARRLTEETGVQYEVDHMIPLQGKTVCGLHVQNNLQVIPQAVNGPKRNKLLPDIVSRIEMEHVEVI